MNAWYSTVLQTWSCGFLSTNSYPLCCAWQQTTLLFVVEGHVGSGVPGLVPSTLWSLGSLRVRAEGGVDTHQCFWNKLSSGSKVFF